MTVVPLRTRKRTHKRSLNLDRELYKSFAPESVFVSGPRSNSSRNFWDVFFDFRGTAEGTRLPGGNYVAYTRMAGSL